MVSITNEKAFETAIEDFLTGKDKGGFLKGNAKDFNKEIALDTNVLFSFIKESQPNEWKKLSGIHRVDVETKFLQRLVKELDSRGTLDVLRNGIIDYGVRFKIAFFRPASGLNPQTEKLYQMNKLTLTRQVKYSLKNENSLDMLISINGLPIATIELKNQFTGQDVENAKRQFKEDRDPNELIFQFKKRALVHFAVDTDNIFLTTKLEGDVKFLPFNKGFENGAGNPSNPKGYKTSYLWEEILERDSFMDIVGRFMHIQIEEFKIEGKTIKKESMLFPRYHQLDCVLKLEADTKENGTGKNYLIQHSAGSGKSNSIAWLAYRLSSLHNKKDKPVFDSIIVVTDRLVLDQQLQNTIYQFEHKKGVVEKIDKNSKQLSEALKSGTKIIITTLQKFPYIIETIGELPKRNYALIIDEVHSSQGGEASKKMKEVLSYKDFDEAIKKDSTELEKQVDTEDEIRKSMEARGMHKNLSFFGFTATPKAKTLEIFGVKNKITGKPEPFHLYSMRQAIEEGFIIDVLKNYTTYQTFFRLSKQIEDDPKINKKKAKRAIARFVALHPHNLAQKTEVMIEHFRQVTMKKIGGKAKAMVITPSRLHVVRYKREFDDYLKKNKYNDIKAIVAFSGIVKDGKEYTEPKMNQFGEKELPDKFNTNEYQLLLVADKYQTGYDQPLLHTMYVDKKLSGIKAVQTLSRLNRTCPGKEDTFILDFVNDDSDIINAFQPYYEITLLEETTDPNKLYDLKYKIEERGVIDKLDVENFCKVFFKSAKYQSIKDHSLLNSYIDPAVSRFRAIYKTEKQEEFKHMLTVFLRVYSFLSQIMPFQDSDLEKFYAYGRLLVNKLPRKDLSERFKLGDEVALEYYRLQKINEGSISLEKGKEGLLKPLNTAGVREEKEEYAKLSEIIKILNERFGTDFTEADKLFFDQIEEELVADEKLSKQAKTNSVENFKYGFQDVFINKVIDRMEQNQDIFKKIMDDKDFAETVKDWMLDKVYKRLNKK